MALTLPLLGVMQRVGLPEGVAAIPVLFVDMATFSIWISFVAPWLFDRLRLGDAPAPGAP